MEAETDQITLCAVVERKQRDLPRYVVVPTLSVAAIGLKGTTTVDVTIDDVVVERRTIKPWDAQRWFISITDVDCRRLGIDTGSQVRIRLRLASTELAEELMNLLETNEAARVAWERLTLNQRRMLRDEIASGKKSATRARRAQRALIGLVRSSS